MRVLRVWPPPSATALGRRPAAGLPFPLEEPGVRRFAQARQALRDCLPSLGLRRGDEVLVPSYHHGSEIQALLELGLHCAVYEPGSDLQPDERELDRLVTARTRALHLIHYLGFPQDAARWRQWCDARGLLLIEDAAQAWLAARDGVPVGTHGDMGVFCLYKSVGLPDGAAVRARVPLPGPQLRGASGLPYVLKPPVRALLSRAGYSRTSAAYDQARDVVVPAQSRAESAMTRYLLHRSLPAQAAQRRRAAYGLLLGELRALVPPPFDELPAAASPFVFPIGVRDKDATLGALHQEGLVGLDLWRLPHPALPVPDDGTAAWLRRHVIGLPVHPSLRTGDLARVVRLVRDVEPAPRSAAPSRAAP